MDKIHNNKLKAKMALSMIKNINKMLEDLHIQHKIINLIIGQRDEAYIDAPVYKLNVNKRNKVNIKSSGNEVMIEITGH